MCYTYFTFKLSIFRIKAFLSLPPLLLEQVMKPFLANITFSILPKRVSCTFCKLSKPESQEPIYTLGKFPVNFNPC